MTVHVTQRSAVATTLILHHACYGGRNRRNHSNRIMQTEDAQISSHCRAGMDKQETFVRRLFLELTLVMADAIQGP